MKEINNKRFNCNGIELHKHMYHKTQQNTARTRCR